MQWKKVLEMKFKDLIYLHFCNQIVLPFYNSVTTTIIFYLKNADSAPTFSGINFEFSIISLKFLPDL